MFQPATFLWEAKAPLKVKAFAWLVAHRKVNTNDLLQVRQPFKSLNPQWCILCKGEGEATDHLFLHCLYIIGLRNKLFNSTGLVWVSPRRIEDIFAIAFKGFGSCTRGKTLWIIACLTLVWFVWQERDVRIFKDKERTEGDVWDLFHLFFSLWASCTPVFRGVPLLFLQLNWLVVCV